MVKPPSRPIIPPSKKSFTKRNNTIESLESRIEKASATHLENTLKYRERKSRLENRAEGEDSSITSKINDLQSMIEEESSINEIYDACLSQVSFPETLEEDSLDGVPLEKAYSDIQRTLECGSAVNLIRKKRNNNS